MAFKTARKASVNTTRLNDSIHISRWTNR